MQNAKKVCKISMRKESMLKIVKAWESMKEYAKSCKWLFCSTNTDRSDNRSVKLVLVRRKVKIFFEAAQIAASIFMGVCKSLS